METYSDATGVHLRTNRFEYAANETDLTRHVQILGATSRQVSSNVYNASHQVITSYNALNESTTNTYDGSSRLTSVSRPSGHMTTNLYGGDGRLASAIDKDGSTSYRTNSYRGDGPGNPPYYCAAHDTYCYNWDDIPADCWESGTKPPKPDCYP